MPIEQIDENFQLMSLISVGMKNAYLKPDSDPWEDSPFQWILGRPSRQRGMIGELLVEQWCRKKGFVVARSPDSQADRIIKGFRFEIKFSTLWTSGVYKFQQIRDQDYDYLFCLGISPMEAHAWILPKDLLHLHVIGKMGQHTGATGKETAWLSFGAKTPHHWMRLYGGSLREAHQFLVKL